MYKESDFMNPIFYFGTGGETYALSMVENTEREAGETLDYFGALLVYRIESNHYEAVVDAIDVSAAIMSGINEGDYIMDLVTRSNAYLASLNQGPIDPAAIQAFAQAANTEIHTYTFDGEELVKK